MEYFSIIPISLLARLTCRMVLTLIEVQCPICDENVKGEGEFDLSINLQEHMRMAHDFKDLAKIEAGKCPDEKPCAEGLGSALL